jgi:hypothetical protein
MQETTRSWISASGSMIAKTFGFVLVLSALSVSVSAHPEPLPEMDPGLAMSAMALLGGGLALIAGRKRRK